MEKDLILRETGGLPATIDELREFILVGKAKLKVYQQKVKLIKDLGLAKQVKDQALEDGQSVGEAILWAEAKMGELLKKISPGRATYKSALPHGERAKLPKGIDSHQAHKARKLADHPEIIKEVIKEAREEEDLPTRSAVLRKIYEREDAERVKPPKTNLELSGEGLKYFHTLQMVINKLPPIPPDVKGKEQFVVLAGLAQTIIKRLMKFLEKGEKLYGAEIESKRISSIGSS